MKRYSGHRPQTRLPEDPGLADVVLGSGVEEGIGSSPFVSPERARGRSELRTALAEAMDRLSEASREILLLREVDGLSYAEIAQVLEIPKGTVMSRLFHARRQLRERLAERGIAAGGEGPRSSGGGDRRE